MTLGVRIPAVIEISVAELRQLSRFGHSHATHLALELPARTLKGRPMSNYPLPNDQVLTITLKATNAGGAFEPLPTGDTFTVQNSDPASLNAVIGQDAAGAPALVVNALVQSAVGVNVTVADAQGLQSISQLFDIVEDTTPAAIVLDVADATHTSQPVPSAASGGAAGQTGAGPTA